MSDKKMIIRNCPVCEFSDWEECTGYLAEGYICNDIHTEIIECQDRTDCVVKRIVEKCKEVNTKFYDSVHQRYLSPSKAKFARQILELLDIEECE